VPSVLIVDDVRLFADVVGSALQRAGYEVEVAGNGRDALDVVRARHPALVILDVAMPQMGGIEALRLLRSDPDPAIAATQVLIVTASSGPPQEEQWKKLGVQGQMLKSRFSLAELIERVRELVPE
jgi:CheY-like chemotaxis protein